MDDAGKILKYIIRIKENIKEQQQQSVQQQQIEKVDVKEDKPK